MWGTCRVCFRYIVPVTAGYGQRCLLKAVKHLIEIQYIKPYSLQRSVLVINSSVQRYVDTHFLSKKTHYITKRLKQKSRDSVPNARTRLLLACVPLFPRTASTENVLTLLTATSTYFQLRVCISH